MLWCRRTFLCSLAATHLADVRRPALSQPAFPTYERFVARATAELATEWQFFAARIGLREQYSFFSRTRILAAESSDLPVRRAAPRDIDRFRSASEAVSEYLRDAITKIGPPFGSVVTTYTLQTHVEINSMLKSGYDKNMIDLESILAFSNFFREVSVRTGRFEFSALTDEDIFVGQMKAALICNALLPTNVMIRLLPSSPFFIFCSNK